MGPADENAEYLCLRTDWHRTLDGRYYRFGLHGVMQSSDHSAGCSMHCGIVESRYSLQNTLEEMALGAVSQFRFFYRRVCKLWLF